MAGLERGGGLDREWQGGVCFCSFFFFNNFFSFAFILCGVDLDGEMREAG